MESVIKRNTVSKPPLNQRKILLLGDSYNYGNGGITGQGWGYYFNQYNGTNGTIIHQNTGGFAAVANSANASYNNCTYADVIDRLSASAGYDLIIAQAGWNDASTGQNPGGVAAISTGVASFVNKCREKWPGCEIIVISTNNDTICNSYKLSCLNEIVNAAYNNKVTKASRNTFLWMQNTGANASDGIHLSDAGYKLLARYIGNYVNGWDGDLNKQYTLSADCIVFAQGFKIAWGQVGLDGNGQGSITFPVAFDAAPNVVAYISGLSQASVFDARSGGLTNTGCQFAATRCNNGGTVTAFANASVRWFAMGI